MGVAGSVAVAGVRRVKIPIACEADGKVYKTFTIQNFPYATSLPFDIISCRALTLTLVTDGEKAGIRFVMDGRDPEIAPTETGQVTATAECCTIDPYVLPERK